MKLVSYLYEGHDHLGVLIENKVYDMEVLHPDLPNNMSMFLNYWEESFPVAQAGALLLKEGTRSSNKGMLITELELLAPVPAPASCRDAYAFRQHAETGRKNGLPAEFDRFPVFYFANHHSIQGPGEVRCMPDHFQQLDFELECAIVICKQGRNIKAEEAAGYIGGLMIMNNLSARGLQLAEMKLGLGPAKGKDFSTPTGPWLVTPDELEEYLVPAPDHHTGSNWNLNMTCKVNGIQVSAGKVSDMTWTFAEIIERVSYGADLYPGDIIGSGAVGTGCFLELNGTGKQNNPDYPEQWLQPGDTVEMEIEGLGILTNTIAVEETD